MVGKAREKFWRAANSPLAFRAAVVVMIGLMGVLLWVSVSTKGDTAVTRQISEGQQITQARNDCARTIANEQAAVKDRRDALRDRITVAYARVSLDLPQVEDPYALLDEFADASADVAALPPTQERVDKECPSVHPLEESP